MNKTLNFLFLGLAWLSMQPLPAQSLKLNESGYFDGGGVNVMVFNNPYHTFFYDEKRSGIDIIHRGVLTASNGCVRLQNTPEQWDLVPETVSHKVDVDRQTVSVVVDYPDYGFQPEMRVSPRGKGFAVEVWLSQPVPKFLEGKAGFNLEFLPSAYWQRSFLIDGRPDYFPRYPGGNMVMRPTSEKVKQVLGYTTYDDRGRGEFPVPRPFAQGHRLVLAPEDADRCVKIESDSTLLLFDGRQVAQNGWYVVRSLLPAGATGKVLEWYVEPKVAEGWTRKPNIGFSQVGYEPSQNKQTIIELDKADTPLPTVTLLRIDAEGHSTAVAELPAKPWGRFRRYQYVTADFSSAREEGIYCLRYGDQTTNTFPIRRGVYRDVWHPSMDVWFPVQMDHTTVREAYRIWHGEPFKDDCVQAPVNTVHFDNYRQGPTTESPYRSLEHIPGFTAGGWFDAGDFDIETPSHDATLLSMVGTWEEFRPARDQTFIDPEKHYAEIHRPDGKADLLQQIAHGVLPIVAQVEQIGHPCRGITLPTLYSYHHLGDASTETDNLVGTGDERWCFTSHDSFIDYYTAAALAAVYRPLKDFNAPLADRCLRAARKVWEDSKATPAAAAVTAPAALELYKSTGERGYLKAFNDSIFKALRLGGKERIGGLLTTALQACSVMDKGYMKKLRPYVETFKKTLNDKGKENPYGVDPVGENWGGNGAVVSQGVTAYYAHKYFPDIIDREAVLRPAHFLFGCHPDHNKSFVAGVGVRTKAMTYGNTRADFTFIAGGVAPGLLALKPDYFENKDDWPFYWGQNECTIGLTSQYVFLGNALGKLFEEVQ